ncbi:MAG: EamA family transporter [Lachnospiraceae bacterium]
MVWMLLVLVYGVLKGAREIAKKKALQKNSVVEVLVFYTLLSFLMVLPEGPKAMNIEPVFLIPVAFKSFIIFVAWMCSFKAIKKLPISIVGILDLSRVLFATLLGYIVLGEDPTVPQVVGLLFVCTGLLCLKGGKRTQKGGQEQVQSKYVVIVMISCILNAVSGLMDKILMRDLTSGELQFWYMLFLMLFYVIYALAVRTKFDVKTLIKNYWVWILSLMFVIADRCLFIANGYPDSKVTIMTLIKQSGCIVTILGGKLIFKEKNITYKLFCATIIIVGIVIAVF